jgi:hypothetical protein
LKLANAQVKCLALDSDLKRLYAATMDGMLLILNVTLAAIGNCEPSMIIIHTMTFHQGLYACNLNLESNRNIMFCLLKSYQ